MKYEDGSTSSFLIHFNVRFIASTVLFRLFTEGRSHLASINGDNDAWDQGIIIKSKHSFKSGAIEPEKISSVFPDTLPY